jgi:hypothetical protein
LDKNTLKISVMGRIIKFKDPNAVMQIKGQDGVFSNQNGRMTPEVYDYLVKLSPDAKAQFDVTEEKENKSAPKPTE